MVTKVDGVKFKINDKILSHKKKIMSKEGQSAYGLLLSIFNDIIIVFIK